MSFGTASNKDERAIERPGLETKYSLGELRHPQRIGATKMAYASNGAAIINGEMVPASEVKVLRTLVGLGRPATVPEIANAMDDEMSDASLYSLLSRLDQKRRLVARQVVAVNVQGTDLRRVVWTSHQEAASFFEADASIDFRTRAQPAGVPG